MKKLVLLLLVLFALSGVACIPGTKTTPQDRVCVSYGGGPFEGKKFQGVHEPGKGRFINGLFDDLYCYPVTERSYIITSRPNEGDAHYADSVVAPSQDNIQLTFELATYFQLNVDKIADFHSAIGIKTAAYEDDGWNNMLAEYFRPQIDQAVQRLARTYEAQVAYSDTGAFAAIQSSLRSELPNTINDALGDDYFEDFRIVLRKIDVPESLRNELLANKESAVRVQTKQNEVRQAEQEAQAIQKRQKALEGCEVCILYEAIKAGTIDFWVIPSGNNLTLQTPQRSAP
jgi:hypothetical protein